MSVGSGLDLACRRILMSFQCAPAVGDFTAARKRAWGQKALGKWGIPRLPPYDELFTQEPLRGIDGPDSEFLSCSPMHDTQIENNTCVLGLFELLCAI